MGAFTSGGNSPVLARYIKDKAADILTPQLGDLNEVLGEQRAFILENFKDENTRKLVINRIIDETVSTGVVPSKQDLISVCTSYKGN